MDDSWEAQEQVQAQAQQSRLAYSAQSHSPGRGGLDAWGAQHPPQRARSSAPAEHHDSFGSGPREYEAFEKEAGRGWEGGPSQGDRYADSPHQEASVSWHASERRGRENQARRAGRPGWQEQQGQGGRWRPHFAGPWVAGGPRSSFTSADQWHSVQQELRVARLAQEALEDAALEEEEAHSSLWAQLRPRTIVRGLRRMWYLIDSKLGSLQTQVSLLVLFAAIMSVCGGKLVELTRNQEFYGYSDDFDPDGRLPTIQTHTSYATGIWLTLGLLTDPGMGIWPDKPLDLHNRIVSQSFIGIGIIFLSVIVGLVVDAVNEKMDALKKGLSPVVERGHTVILGWEETALTIVQQLALANQSEGGGVIVVLSTQDKAAMERGLASFMSPAELLGTKVVFRCGSRLRCSDLRHVSIESARSVIAVSSMELSADTADAEMLQVALNLSTLRLQPDAVVVVEVRDIDAEPLMRLVGGEQVRTVTSHDIIGRLMLLFVRQPGLARVYEKVLGFEGSEFYVAEWPQLVDERWADVAFHFYDAVAIGIIASGTGAVVLNPRPETVVRRGDCVVVLAEDNDSYTWEPSAELGPRRTFISTPPPVARPEEVLFAGWRRDVAYLVLMLDRVIAPGSVLHILCPLKVSERRKEFAANGLDEATGLRNLRVVHHLGNSALKRHVIKLPLARISSVVVLSDDAVKGEIVYSDSRALATLLLVGGLKASVSATPGGVQLGDSSTMVVEILDPRTQRTVNEANDVFSASDFIQSNEIISKIMAMISEEQAVKKILDQLMGATGTHLTLIPASELLGANQEASFWELSRECVLAHHCTLCGYVEPGAPALNGTAAAASSCVINPPEKDLRRSWYGVQLVLIRTSSMAVSAPPEGRAQSPGKPPPGYGPGAAQSY